MSVCHACGVVHVPGERFCRKCGQRSRAFSIVWTVSGAFLMIALAGLALIVLYRGWAAAGAAPTSLHELDSRGKLALAASFAAAFLLGGITVGRASEGRTILEAGIAATIALGMIVGYAALRRFDLTELRLPIIIALPAAFVLALAGAWLGERWQGSSVRD